MTARLRTVFDTNVLVSAVLLPSSVPRQAFDLASQLGKLLLSVPTIRELDAVLRRPRFNRYLSEEERIEFLTTLVQEAELLTIVERVAVCRDSSDDKFLELAVSGRATHIVSGDPDLLVLHPFRGMAVLSPAAFLTQNTLHGGEQRA
ncbi:MAG: putative toxin-antitoxin system toxin component, PIN family [Acidobacteria bacterium]|nr:putative toxin-antitoxin system toxin component, PIN family [Acidobacteriota bacterium]